MTNRGAFIVDLGLRRAFRRLLDRESIPYSEDKGFLNSQFIVTVTDDQADMLEELVETLQERRRGR